ncbi:MAG TPA: CPBP family glutamic-type intramembrane protease [Limnochordia bacterium]
MTATQRPYLRRDDALYVAGAAFALASLAALGVALAGMAALSPAVFLGWLASAWLHANLYLWMAPTSRIDVIYQRGRLLGFGFAVGLSVIASIGMWGRWPGGAAAAAALWLVGTMWPFVLPPLLELVPGRPHPADAAVWLYAAFLPAFGPFSGLLFGSTVSELPSGAAALGHFGLLAAGTLAATYFLGVRQWQEVSNYWFLRRADLPWVAGGTVGLCGLSWLATALWLLPGAEPAAPLSLSVASAVGTITTAAVVQELFFRGLCLPGLVRACTARRRSARPPAPTWRATALPIALSAALYALPWPVLLEPAGVRGMVIRGAAGLLLGWIVLRTDRLFPAIAAHGLAAAALSLMGIAAGLV